MGYEGAHNQEEKRSSNASVRNLGKRIAAIDCYIRLSTQMLLRGVSKKDIQALIEYRDTLKNIRVRLQDNVLEKESEKDLNRGEATHASEAQVRLKTRLLKKLRYCKLYAQIIAREPEVAFFIAIERICIS